MLIFEFLQYYHEKLIKYGKDYVHALAREQKSIDDHAYAPSETHYDLKKTLAVLLENLMLRIDSLELAVRQLIKNQSDSSISQQYKEQFIEKDNSKDGRMSAADIAEGKQEECLLAPNTRLQYPHCEEKIKWMDSFWRSDPCYASFGVCSITLRQKSKEEFDSLTVLTFVL